MWEPSDCSRESVLPSYHEMQMGVCLIVDGAGACWHGHHERLADGTGGVTT